MPDSEEPVGSLAEEAARLFAAVVTGGEPASDAASASSHACPHGWCPFCQAADYLQEHPEVVAQVLVAGAELLKVVRDAVEKATGSREEQP
ncbi:hypothetical protein [Aeromicrobium sp. Leaf350]|uniref:hypothetical protein n=1 Tax=Aeromicrobium sp. Leaf350 TaxID=2876565 RepID=UPI001E2E271A|nr:hypothetical protein [Aeromicrobium sp. Leaf350]